jgi:hypothetical protein
VPKEVKAEVYRTEVAGATRVQEGLPTVPQGAERSHPFPLIPISYGFLICCHGNFPEFLGRAGQCKARIGRARNKWNAGA